LEKSGVGPGVLKSLITKEVLIPSEHEIGRIQDKPAQEDAFELSEGQQKVKAAIESGLEEKGKVLLHGVTGSGKTEVYIRIMERYLEEGKKILYLVPEIALTTQLVQRLQKHFGSQVAVYHSHYSQSERHEIWQNLLEPGVHDHRIILGARSAIFLPMKDLGLIIVDEEHDASFKQFDPAPRYHARDTAYYLARLHEADMLLGSATPSAESIQACKDGQMVRVDMHQRYGGVRMPEILVADMTKEAKVDGLRSHYSFMLRSQIEEALHEGRQVILFQNRRGYQPTWQCGTCGWVSQCTRCDVSMTYHKHIHRLKCHYCGSHQEPPLHCPACGSKQLQMLGFGTEKVEEELTNLFPKAKVARLDSDTTRSKNAYEKILERFEQRETDILVGTQMITKGLDFANVGVVGILDADMLIYRNDFRAFERAYQMMTQVAGRAGRSAEAPRGKVVVQTKSPEHWVIQNVVEHTYDRLIDQELLERRNFGYPPFVRMIRLTVRHKDRQKVEDGAAYLVHELRTFLGERVLGPEYPYIPRLKDQYRKEMVVKVEREASIHKVKENIQNLVDRMGQDKQYRALRIIIDVDPQ